MEIGPKRVETDPMTKLLCTEDGPDAHPTPRKCKDQTDSHNQLHVLTTTQFQVSADKPPLITLIFKACTHGLVLIQLTKIDTTTTASGYTRFNQICIMKSVHLCISNLFKFTKHSTAYTTVQDTFP